MRVQAYMRFDFDAVFYYVSDLERAITFYKDVLGFKLESQDCVARFLMGRVLFELVPTAAYDKLQGNGNARLCVGVDDIKSAISYLHSKGVTTAATEIKDNGLLTRFHDPDGNEICLWQ